MADSVTCCVCGNTNIKDVKAYKSALTDDTRYYCSNCIFSGLEPYTDLINFGWEFDMFTKSFQQKVIIPTLTKNNKTVQQFNADVENRRKETDS